LLLILRPYSLRVEQVAQDESNFMCEIDANRTIRAIRISYEKPRAATQHHTRRDMAVVSDLAIMFHNRAGVRQRISSDSCGWLDDRTRPPLLANNSRNPHNPMKSPADDLAGGTRSLQCAM
jgi:hypothetical protein